MIGAVWGRVTRFLGYEDVFREEPDNMQEILRELNIKEREDEDMLDVQNNSFDRNECQSDRKLGQSDPVEYDVEVYNCSHKTGKVTYICEEYGYIDKVIYFDLSKVSKTLKLREGDEVAYTTYRASDNKTESVYEVYALTHEDDSWEIHEENDLEKRNELHEKENQIVGMATETNGRVTKRKGRELFIEPMNIWCSLDKINATYIPIEGDWVSLETTVTVNQDKMNLMGDILEIKSLKPVLSKHGCGRITFWSDIKQEGAIENQIFFHRSFCMSGYVPNLGDEVTYEAIESDQESYRWRALNLSPKGVRASVKSEDNQIIKNLLTIAKKEKDITITPHICCVKVEMNGFGEGAFEIFNKGSVEQVLVDVRPQREAQNSQIKVVGPFEKSPSKNGKVRIRPNDTYKVTFECCGKFLGRSEENCVFQFDGFKIVKIICLDVGGSEDMNEVLHCKMDTVFRHRGRQKFIRKDLDSRPTLSGPKPWQSPKFIAGERRGHYKVPTKLWDIVVGDPTNDERASGRASIVKDLEEYAPYMAEELNGPYYADRFHMLLYLEEIEQRRAHASFDRTGVFLYRRGEYFSLGIPRLSAQPSLIVGNKIVLTQPWSELYKDVRHVGYIYEVRQNEIYVKFHECFHESYDESECDVSFEPSTGQLMAAHDAVNRATKRLGPKLLFPSAVNEKPSQVDFTVDEEEDNADRDSKRKTNISDADFDNLECEIDEVGCVVKKNRDFRQKLVWFNKKLNERQKLAVMNVLKGHGRPLPYVIFGPPGTGKTITLVELVLQIHRLIPGSRLLITTPSNSAADLLCERLIDMGKFKPGQLVRLVAYHRVVSNNVPPKLVPYSTLVDIADDSNKSQHRVVKNGNFVVSSFNQLVGRHRITVGTCTCIGSLHQMPFPLGHFTHILVDEAGQATEPDILIPISFQNPSNGQVVLVGDPQQLGPVCLSQLAKKYGLGVSMIQRLLSFFPYQKDVKSFPEFSGYDPRFVTRLNVNYRSVPEILRLPSDMFYDSELIPTVSDTMSYEATIIEKFDFKRESNGKPAAIIFHGIMGQNYQEEDTPSWFNPHEVWQAVTYLKRLYKIGLKCTDVGIITPYSKQTQKIQHVLNALNMAQPKIGTVEDFQGQERHVIILSAVRSHTTQISQNILQALGFVACPQRLNVALTRARALLIILGNPLILSKDPCWKTVYEYCCKNNSYTGCNVLELDAVPNETPSQ